MPSASLSEAAHLELCLAGALLLSPTGKIISANTAAHQLLRSHPALFEQNGQLIIRRVDEAKLFAEALAATASKRLPSLAVMRTRQGAPIVAIALSPAQERHHVFAVIADLHAKLTISIEDLRTLFRFTNAEARIAQGLANGANATSLAAELNISINTVRSTLSTLLPKAGATSQSRLIAILLRAEHAQPRYRGQP